jgi:hypothetical protein
MHREADPDIEIQLVDEIWLHILNMVQIRSHDEINIMSLSSVSKQWHRVMFSLGQLKVTLGRLFTSNYEVNPMRYTRANSLKLVSTQKRDPNTFDDIDYHMYLNTFLARLPPLVTQLHLAHKASGILNFSETQFLFHFSKNLTHLVLEDTYIRSTILEKLPHLKHLKFIHTRILSQVIDTKPLDHVDLIEDVPYSGNSSKLANRTGRVIIHTEKNKVEGFMNNGLFVGPVKMTMYMDNTVYRRYDGYVNDAHNPHGHGVCVWLSHHKHNQTTALSPSRYEGEYQNGDRHGKGVMNYVNGSKYEGDWIVNRHGYGVMKFSDGATYEGDYVNGSAHGIGTLHHPSGQYYHGEFENGVMQGKGTITRKEGKYTGYFRNNLYHGHGEKTDIATNTTYIGNWVDGKPHGKGLVKTLNGDVIQKGRFESGKFVHGTLYSSDQKTMLKGDFNERLFKGRVYTIQCDTTPEMIEMSEILPNDFMIK